MAPHLHIKTIFLAFCTAAFGFAQSNDGAFFDNSTVQEIRLTLRASDWQSLKDNYLDDTYYSSAFAWQDASLANVGIRSRGSGSRSPEKPNLTVKFSKYVSGQRFLGLDTVTLKANNQDASLVKESVAMQFYGNFGVPVPREAPARLFINGEYFGYYTIVEAIDESFLTRVFGESDGYLYEFNPVAGYHFGYLGDDPSAYSTMFEAKTHEKSPDTATLIELIRRVNQVSDAEFLNSVSAYLDIRGLVTLLALEDYLTDNDGILSSTYGMNNFYLYRFENSTLHTFLPWDADLTFDWRDRPIFAGVDTNILARRALAVPDLRQLYLDTLLRAAAFDGGAGGWLHREIDRQYALIADDAHNDPHKQCMKDGAGVAPCTAADFETAVATLRQFAIVRAGLIEASVASLLPGGAPQVSTGGVVSAAPAQAVLTAGGLATIYGAAFAKTVAQAQVLPLPYVLDGVSVTINGVPAPMLYVSPDQVNIQVPWGVAVGTAQVVISASGTHSAPAQAKVGAAAPGIYAVTRATPGILAIYATGLGPVSVTPADGQPSPGDPLAQPLDAPTASIGGQPANVLFAGLAPGMVGVFQINVEIPAGVEAGADVTVSAGGETSQAVKIPNQ